MPNRRDFLQTGLSAGIALGTIALTPTRTRGQSRSPLKVRYSEVVRSMFFAPTYAAISRGFFREAGLEVELSTANGGDRSMAALQTGGADIALVGPEVPIYMNQRDSTTTTRIFCGMTAADGYLLCAREKTSSFDWAALRGREIMGWRQASTPLIFLEAALRLKGLDPQSDVNIVNGIAPPARQSAWLGGQTEFAIFSEPEASQLELDGKAHVVASIGATVGMVDYTVFAATGSYLRENASTVQAWTDAIARSMKWTRSATTAELVTVLLPFFPQASPRALAGGIERYRALQLWKATPGVERSAIDRFQDIMVQGKVLDASKRVSFENVVTTQFAERAA